MANEKMIKISHLLSNHKFIIVRDFNDDYKCGICNGILNNAHQAICGCHFCYACIKQSIDNGSEKCPICERRNLSISPNYRLNNQISEMIVKCPHSTCLFQCQLIEMDQHLRICTLKDKICPFFDFGCQYKSPSSENVNEHLLHSMADHSKILLESIGLLRNEIRELKDKDERNQLIIEILKTNENENRLEIEILREKDREKDEIIESLRNGIDMIKQENANVKESANIGIGNLRRELRAMDKEINDKCTNNALKSVESEIKKIKIEKSELAERMHIVDETITIEINSTLFEMRQKLEGKFNDVSNTILINFLEMVHHGGLFWQIGKPSDIKLMWSDFFYSKLNPYKMRLRLENVKDKLEIWMCIHYGRLDAYLQWPMEATVTIDISPLVFETRNNTKSTTVKCFIQKPTNDLIQWHAFFISHQDLLQKNLMSKICLLQCLVSFQ